MARNKRDVDRAQKQEEIELAATRLFLEGGYDATSMAAVAGAAGVAPNTLYWYYANKDELLIAVLNRLMARTLEVRAGIAELPLPEQLLWLIQVFEQAHNLVLTVHGRLDQSKAIFDWHAQFHQKLEALLVATLVAQGMSEEEAVTLATAGTFIVEGLLSHPHTLEQREKVIRWLLSKGWKPDDSYFV